MDNRIVKENVLEIVDNQIRTGEPPCAAEAFEELCALGYSQEQAREELAAILMGEMYLMIDRNQEFDLRRYEEAIAELVSQARDEGSIYREEEPWIGMRQLLETGREYMERFQKREGLAYWERAWELLRENIRASGKRPEIIEIDEETDFRYLFEEWLTELSDVYLELGEKDKCFLLCQEIAELFSGEGECARYRILGGSILEELGRTEEAAVWYTQWLREEPDNYSALDAAVRYFAGTGQSQYAEKLLDEAVEGNPKIDYENQNLFRIAASLYKLLGREEKAGHCQESYEAFCRESMGESEAAVKDRKETLAFFDE